MKDSKEKEHRISNLKDMIDNVKEDPNLAEEAEDSELIDYLNEDKTDYDGLEINDEFIYHPGDEKDNAINLEDNAIDEEFIIKTPKEEDIDESAESFESDEPEDIISDMTENFDVFVNAKIGKTPILAIISSVLGFLLVIISIIIFQSRSDRVIDNVVSGETNFIVVIVLAIGILLLIYGLYQILGFKNPIKGITDNINSIDLDIDKDSKSNNQPDEKIIPKSNIPLDKDSYKIGEFDLSELKSKLKKPSTSKKSIPITENIDDIPPAKEKEESKKGLIAEEIEDIEYEQVKLDHETIDDIFAEVEEIEEMPIISIDSEDKKEE